MTHEDYRLLDVPGSTVVLLLVRGWDKLEKLCCMYALCDDNTRVTEMIYKEHFAIILLDKPLLAIT